MSVISVTPARIRKNAFLLAAGLVCNSGMFQLAAALSSLTLAAVTGITGILGLGPAIFLTAGLALMTLSNASLVWLGGVGGMSFAPLGLGLGWNLSYVGATTELVSLSSPSERGKLVGFSDLVSSLVGASLALLGGLVYTAGGVASLAVCAAALAALPALWLPARPAPRVALSPAD